ncbi:MAG TPA: DSD1 family PLP-dependent enzyme [Burkholderiales bacterium]|nr:DSD1 family PLP-dependent enzyme [Burkholderiales bacterium]
MSIAPPARIGAPLEEVDTPALTVDLDALEGNIARMAKAAEGGAARLRPHAKSHKCAEIARAQVAAGAVGVCAQKVSEAEALVAGGVADVLVTNEIVGRQKVGRLARLAREAKVAVLADDAGNVAELDAAAHAERVRLEVLVEIDAGAHRCGVEPGAPALALAKAIAACRNLRFAGLHAYHGAAQHLRAADERRAAIADAAEKARTTKALIEEAGIACGTVTGAGTGTFLLEGASRVFNEIQPGSYVFMDADYNRNEWQAGWPRFEQSLFVLATVMSAPAADRAVVDAGLKASSVDSGMPLVHERPGVEYAKASDEHGVLRIVPGAKAPELGEKILLVPGHCDPTVNLYDWLVCVRKGRVEALWAVAARGALY